jgi:tetratricopeptide (TPR) repeat protein
MPSVPKLATLANIFERPIQEFVDLYEIEHLKSLVPDAGRRLLALPEARIDYRAEGDPWAVRRRECCEGSMPRALRRHRCDRAGAHERRIALISLSRYHAAQRFLEEALASRPDRPDPRVALHNLARAHFQLDNESLADYLSQKAGELAIDDRSFEADFHSVRAVILGSLSRFEQAIAHGGGPSRGTDRSETLSP